MSDELTKSQDLSAQITEEEVELSDQDLEDVAGGTAISSVDSSATAAFGGVAVSDVHSTAVDNHFGSNSHRGGSHHHHSC